METEEKEKAAAPVETTEVVKKKRVKKLPVPLKAQIAGLSSKALQVRAPVFAHGLTRVKAQGRP